MLLRINSPNGYFWQWDLNRRLIVADEVCGEVHFCNGTTENAVVCGVYEADGQRLVDVPNILLQIAKPLTAYLYLHDKNGCMTMHQQVFHVIARNKPDGYVYTETEVLTWTALDKRITDLENAEGVSPEEIAEAVGAYLDENPIEETDPTVPKWAKQPEKPSYTAEEVGALPADTKIPDALKNPHALTFTGAVTGSYDGSVPVTVNIPEGGGGGGFSDDQKVLLLNLLKNAAYERDVSAAVAQLENLLNGGSAIAYAVTNNLTDVTTSNNAATAKYAFPYEAKLTVAEGQELNETALTVFMGGVNITATAYADGVVFIPVVTGEIIITAKAKEQGLVYDLAPETVFDKTTGTLDTGYHLADKLKPFTMLMHFDSTTLGSAWNGHVFCVHIATATNINSATYALWRSLSTGLWPDGTSKTEDIKFAIVSDGSSNNTTLYSFNNGSEVVTYNMSLRPAVGVLIGNDTPLYIGFSGWTGTFHRFTVYEKALSEEEIYKFLGVN